MVTVRVTMEFETSAHAPGAAFNFLRCPPVRALRSAVLLAIPYPSLYGNGYS